MKKTIFFHLFETRSYIRYRPVPKLSLSAFKSFVSLLTLPPPSTRPRIIPGTNSSDWVGQRPCSPSTRRRPSGRRILTGSMGRGTPWRIYVGEEIPSHPPWPRIILPPSSVRYLNLLPNPGGFVGLEGSGDVPEPSEYTARIFIPTHL